VGLLLTIGISPGLTPTFNWRVAGRGARRAGRREVWVLLLLILEELAHLVHSRLLVVQGHVRVDVHGHLEPGMTAIRTGNSPAPPAS
jgi:hypothetical protein